MRRMALCQHAGRNLGDIGSITRPPNITLRAVVTKGQAQALGSQERKFIMPTRSAFTVRRERGVRTRGRSSSSNPGCVPADALCLRWEWARELPEPLTFPDRHFVNYGEKSWDTLGIVGGGTWTSCGDRGFCRDGQGEG